MDQGWRGFLHPIVVFQKFQKTFAGTTAVHISVQGLCAEQWFRSLLIGKRMPAEAGSLKK